MPHCALLPTAVYACNYRLKPICVQVQGTHPGPVPQAQAQARVRYRWFAHELTCLSCRLTGLHACRHRPGHQRHHW